ncbi:hypothetical protein FRC17_010062 [Serendipita sp. 399]|nr:hypothetical protein FRC17_010062 [Serendipita sp. 399]
MDNSDLFIGMFFRTPGGEAYSLTFSFTRRVDELVSSLNLLLDNLEIPLHLESPQDLTPGLLLAILESTLKLRLPLPSKIRQSQSSQAKIETIKVFLGVLGTDILEIDLSDIDPQRLAEGEWDEVVYIGELLVTVAQQQGLLVAEEIVDLDPSFSTSQIGSESSFFGPLSPKPVDIQIKSSLRRPTLLETQQSAPMVNRKGVSASVPVVFPPASTSSSSYKRSSRPPERESTPPPVSPQINYHKPSNAAEWTLDTSQISVDCSVCSCTGDLNRTTSTMHCICHHEVGDGSSIASTVSDKDTEKTIIYANRRPGVSNDKVYYDQQDHQGLTAAVARGYQLRLSDQLARRHNRPRG